MAASSTRLRQHDECILASCQEDTQFSNYVIKPFVSWFSQRQQKQLEHTNYHETIRLLWFDVGFHIVENSLVAVFIKTKCVWN